MAKLSPLQKAYRNFFLDKMEEYEVTSPSQLNDEEKIEFFNDIKRSWKKEKKAMGEGMDINQSIMDNLKLEEAELSPKQKAFRQVFNDLLDQYGVDSPAELDDEKKISFFNAVDSEWKGVEEGYEEDCEDDKKQSIMDGKNINEDAKEGKQEHKGTLSNMKAVADLVIGKPPIKEETSTADVSTFDTKITDKEKQFVSEVCKGKGYKLVGAKVIGEGKAKFFVENFKSGKTGVITYNDNTNIHAFETDKRSFMHLENALDWITTYQISSGKNAQAFIKEETLRNQKQHLEDTKYSCKTSGLSESETKRRLDRGGDLVSKIVKIVPEKKKVDRPIFGDK